MLDRGVGQCLLNDHRFGNFVTDAISAGDGIAHVPLAWVIMPNHVHLLTGQLHGQPLWKMIKQIKAVSAINFNRCRNTQGALWQKGYFDRPIRDQEHLLRTMEYIHGNPVKAKLVANQYNWKQSSIHRHSIEEVMERIHNFGLKSIS
jgi:hypothetical protein